MTLINESDIEQHALDQLSSLGYQDYRSNDYNHPNVYLNNERNNDDYNTLLNNRLKESLIKINPNIHDNEIINEAVKQFNQLADSPSLMENNHKLHQLLINGVKITRSINGEEQTYTLHALDFSHISNNDFVITNQFTIQQGNNERRPDIVIFINGLPLVTFELKSFNEDNINIEKAYNQLQTYKSEITNYMSYNEVSIISDGINAEAGSLSARFDRFKEWRAPKNEHTKFEWELDILIKYMLNPKDLLNIIQNFIIFEQYDDNYNKILAAYHQYYMVNKAIYNTKISLNSNNKKIGVVWHTQGSGKSLSMVFFTGIVSRELSNPTFVIINDRIDLDNQLFNTFSEASEFLGQEPNNADDSNNMRDLLSKNAGGIVFSTIQKFMPNVTNGEEAMPMLTDNSNVIVMADEAHRSQYGLGAEYNKEKGVHFGYAKYLREALPNASFIGFTGTPIDLGNKSTRGVFGNYIDIYDMTQSVKDHTTVKIYYENDIIPLTLDKSIKEKYRKLLNKNSIDDADISKNQKHDYTKLQSVAGSKKRIEAVAKHFINQFEKSESYTYGKSMIVESSRWNAVKLYNEITKLRPKWANDSIEKGKIKVVMTSNASDGPILSKYHTNKLQRNILQHRMKQNIPGNPNDLKIVIVVDMWLTGFDAPSLNTMYIDKPMKGHNLMQAIARVNRVFHDKNSGLLVDYIGIANNLKQALYQYSDNDKQQTGIDISKAIHIMNEKYSIIKEDFLYNVNYLQYNSKDYNKRINTLKITLDHLLGQSKHDQKSFCDNVQELRKTFALVSSTNAAQKIASEVSFFAALKNSLQKLKNKSINTSGKLNNINYRFNQLIDQSVLPEKKQDLYKNLGLKKTDISILSNSFLNDMKNLPQKNLSKSILEKVLRGKIKAISKTNVVKAKNFNEMLEDSINAYNKRGITTDIVISQLINMAKIINQEQQKGKKINLSPEEQAFYDALSNYNKAVNELGKDKLHVLAKKLLDVVKNDVGTDWVERESVRANMRINIKKLLRKYNYPPDFQKDATNTVVKQAEQLSYKFNS